MTHEYIDIYTITSFVELDDKWGTKGGSRCFGYYTTFEMADNAVRHNATDIYECTYSYAVIEKMPEGLAQCAFERWFYKYNRELDSFEPIEEPEFMAHLVNFGIG